MKKKSKGKGDEASRMEETSNDIYLAKIKKLEYLNDCKRTLETDVIKL